MTRAEFAQEYYNEAEKATKNTGLFPETLLVQAILESNSGDSSLTKKANNFFGIKAGTSWTGKIYTTKTREFKNGTWITENANFRAYNNATESFKDWVSFLQKNKRYENVFDEKTPVAQLKAIANAGYATDPNYSSLTTSIYTRLQNTFETASALVKQNPLTSVAVIGTIFFLILSNGKKRNKI